MPLIHNQTQLPLEAGKTLFDYADDLAVRVPTSCNRNGECHECIVEVRQGMDALDPLADTESFLRDNYRLACQAHVVDIEADIEFNILRRQPRILTESIEPATDIDTRPPNHSAKATTSSSKENQFPSPAARGKGRRRWGRERGMPGAARETPAPASSTATAAAS